MSRSALFALGLAATLVLTASTAIACDHHMNIEATAQAAAVSQNVSAPEAPPTSTKPVVVITPASSAAMSTAAALGTDPPVMRCRRMHSLEALTQ